MPRSFIQKTALIVLIWAAVLVHVARAENEGYVGLEPDFIPSEEPPGLRVSIVPGAPAAMAGVQNGDILTGVDGVAFSSQPDVNFMRQYWSALMNRHAGDTVTLNIFRANPDIVITKDGKAQDSEVPLLEFPELISALKEGEDVRLDAKMSPRQLNIRVTLAPRPAMTTVQPPPVPANAVLPCNLPDLHPQLRNLMNALVEQRNVRADVDALYKTLDDISSWDDGFRLTRVTYLLRDSLKSEAMSRQIDDRLALAAGRGVDGYADIQNTAAELLDLPELIPTSSAAPVGPHSAAEHLDYLQARLEESALHVKAAFAAYSPDEVTFIASQRNVLTDVFAPGNYLKTDDGDPRQLRANLRLIQLARKLDYKELNLAQGALASIANTSYLVQLRTDLSRELASDLSKKELLTRDTSLGKIVVSGTGRAAWDDEAPALLIDLGGNDFYTANASSGYSLERPVGVLIDFGGDDAYESNQNCSQGSGSMGCGLLIDFAGDDEYIGLRWSQATGYFGMGALLDLAGNDVYRGSELCQGAAIFGAGILADFGGDDHMEGQNKCQAFGGAHGIGMLIDCNGNDYRYAKAKYSSPAGSDPGIFSCFSQGSAMGFRDYASGGIAVLLDLAGKDYAEGGSFCQGGGYYYGLGVYDDRGVESDHYVGSCYNQGFAAHQACGVMLEEGGNDFYTTRRATAQGIAWDQSSALLIDYAGDDRYEGGETDSQGASANNSVCVFWDRGGKDTYAYPEGQGRVITNDFAGGSSVSLFVDEGGGEDGYDSVTSSNNGITGWPQHGFFADLPKSLEDAVSDSVRLALWHETNVPEDQ